MLLSKNSAGPQVLIKIYLHYSLFSLSNIEIFLRRLHETINSKIMRFDFYLSRVRRDDDILNILRVDNCSEVDIAGNVYKQDGKYYDDCCDLENENAPECSTDDYDWSWLESLGTITLIVITFFGLSCLCIGLLGNLTLLGEFLSGIFRCFWDRLKTCYNNCYNTCCEPQPIVRNDNNATRNGTERSNISTISDNYIRSLVDRLPRSRASEALCTGQSKYFF